MTVGKKVSALFPGVSNCMQTDDLELKKLVIMAVNTFVKDLKRMGQFAWCCSWSWLAGQCWA